jgi:hypothetical protein
VNCADRAAEAGAAGAAEAVVAALRAFPDNWVLQYKGCELLAKLLQTADIRRRAFSSGAGEAISTVMRTHIAQLLVQAAGCNAFCNLFCEGAQTGSKPVHVVAASINTVVAAMTAHASDGDMQCRACIALFNMTVYNRSRKAIAAAAGGIEATAAALRAHATHTRMQTAGCKALLSFCEDMPGHQAKAFAAGGIEAVVQALHRHAADAELQEYGCTALAIMVENNRGSVQRAHAAGALDAVVASAMGTAAVTPRVFDAVCRALAQLVPGREAAAVLAGALEALQRSTVTCNAYEEAARSRLLRQLQPTAQQHDARLCTHAGCKRCAAARARGAMCALAGCGIRTREGGKKLQRCITCRTARYCSEAHQLDDFQRHKPECFALRDRQAGASGAAN